MIIEEGADFPLNQHYAFQASQIRGVLINHIILLERIMDTYIANYFCADLRKATELMDIIISTKRITFESKAQILRTLLDKTRPSQKAENAKLSSDFQEIAGQRNMLAHYMLDPSSEAIERFKKDKSTITLLKFEKIRTPEIFDLERVKKFGNLLDYYVLHLNNLLN